MIGIRSDGTRSSEKKREDFVKPPSEQKDNKTDAWRPILPSSLANLSCGINTGVSKGLMHSVCYILFDNLR